MTSFQSFCVQNAPGVTLYRRQNQSPTEAVPAEWTRAQLPFFPAPDTRPSNSSDEAGNPEVDISAANRRIPARPTLADVRRHADIGAWECALQYCEELLALDKLNPDVYFYRALVLEQAQRHAEADRSLRQAIYLDRTSVLPHYYQGLFLQSRGALRQAARSFQNTLDLLDSRRGPEILANADGISVAELKGLAERHLAILREQT